MQPVAVLGGPAGGILGQRAQVTEPAAADALPPPVRALAGHPLTEILDRARGLAQRGPPGLLFRVFVGRAGRRLVPAASLDLGFARLGGPARMD